MDPFSEPYGFQNLLNSQQPNPSFSYVSREPSIQVPASDARAFGTGCPEDANEDEVISSDRKERRKWSPTEDKVLISAWLNTSKDPVVGNEQKAMAFWKRIAAYFGSSPQLGGYEKRDTTSCKSRWGRLMRACASLLVAMMLQPNKNRVARRKFTLEHAWLELRHDQKWCGGLTSNVNSKRRKLDDQSPQSSTSVSWSLGGDEGMARQAGVKAAKGKSKPAVSKGKTSEVEGKLCVDFQNMWEIKQKDFELKEKFNKHKLLDSLITKTEPLTEPEIALKNKLINDMLDLAWETDTNSGLCEDATYPSHMFRRRFRMNKPLFMRIVDRLSAEIPYFQQRRDATGRFGHSQLQKATTSIRMMAYGCPADAVDEYLRLGETTALLCLEHFVQGIINLFGEEYLRRPTPEDLQRLLDIGEIRGFPGMVGSIDCMHWEWKNCPTAWKGQYTRGSGKPIIVLEAVASADLWIWHAFFGPPGTLNDINVLDRSPVFDDILQGRAPKVNYIVNGYEYHLAYYLTDGIYPK
uniref:Myb-like domain-containing protein n=1 Tax=Brassica oleracea var. oleracea TaxID=109376 RepID=A0A0D3BUY1_BRAOL